MTSLIKKLHMYTGLLNFSILFVYGASGLLLTAQPAPGNRPRPKPETRFVDFQVPAGLTDKQVADRVWETLQLPLTAPPQPQGIRRDPSNNLRFGFFTPSNAHQIVVLEKENRLRVETVRNDIWRYLFALHGTALGHPSTDWRIQAWAWYNEFAIWSLIGMVASGVYLWLASRPGFRWAQVSLAAGLGIFALLFLLTR